MTTDENQTSWLSPLVGDSASINTNLAQIRDYAYATFDKLDRDKNGFIENSELIVVRADPSLSEQERSFIDFLLSNRQQIADAYDENDSNHAEGISRQDIEAYFDLITSLL
ncbi:MAG: hypothetical protein K2W82_01425 [Candidatus Obscuribacterales bacterium]|nr:hypothetical protein [Candidatus Obscuribacterales bacterium]